MFVIKNSYNNFLFESEDIIVLKKELKKIVYTIRNKYMHLGKVYASYKNRRTSVILSFVPYNNIRQVEKFLDNFNIVSI